ncbi:hypothetical protein L9Z73_00570 [Pseudomonas sp. TNT11]|jgi:hypothetical protein|uniref:Uncharacterized protein n=1 Tax=Pseudomonas emilianonis TaxID=2915812 RepID=A0ABT0EB88_9PSED|nr:hypothetical protein [Pseudomonas emilianonis]MCK1782910.1 hypothetical protein [Pseudomonas emilianonis]
MNEAIKQITETLDQQMELNFFMAGKLIDLSPADDRKRLKKELHTRLSLLRERTLEATIALEDLVGRGSSPQDSLLSKLVKSFRRSV